MSGVLVIRTPSGLSGDMLLAGLAVMAGEAADIGSVLAATGLPLPPDAVEIRPHALQGISGWQARVRLPHEHAHRRLGDILALIEASHLSAPAKTVAARAFTLLAEAEGAVHGRPPGEIAFHEVGALDSILDTCVAAELLARIAPDRLVCSPLPLCDGTVRCAHGPLPTPAPAVQELLRGVPVRGLASTGETVTPTAIAFLRAAGFAFGYWPEMVIRQTARIYGGRVLPEVPNGALFALGDAGLAPVEQRPKGLTEPGSEST
ncbi:nickel insertion protein [Rhodovulum visakhapatnamense]|uniref:nickel insertion protein n=1 Tax=Rhodovulum visakhapatnamense TaxID=364297 RepID=UPI0010659656|nr:nickel insertion protein [Rhodovulum visakhapatnamense]